MSNFTEYISSKLGIEKNEERNKPLEAERVQAEAQQRHEAEQATAAKTARDRLIALRMRRANRGGTLLTQPGEEDDKRVLGA